MGKLVFWESILLVLVEIFYFSFLLFCNLSYSNPVICSLKPLLVLFR